MVGNQEVIEEVKEILSEEFQDYWGYHNITAELKDLGYTINPKKVYRLLKECKLIKPSKRLRNVERGRKYVKFRKVMTQNPLECV